MSELSELRVQVFEEAHRRCEWPACQDGAEELAHIRHRGMGGNPQANMPGNVLALCRLHHTRYDEARLTSSDVHNLLEAVGRRGPDRCVFPTCGWPVQHRRQVLPGHVSWRNWPLCAVHADATDLSRLMPRRRAYLQPLLLRLAERRRDGGNDVV